jgi:hypothetical protein
MRLRLLCIVLVGLCALGAPGLAQAAGGSYVFAGGTAQEQAQVRAALEASSFDWSLVPQTITIRLARGHDSEATPGTIWLDADLVDAGRFAWGTIQHEYAHQVDFFLLDDAKRARLQAALGGSTWWAASPAQAHGELGCERFASTLAWTFWQSRDNALRPTAPDDESAALAPARFKTLLTQVLGVATLTNAPRLVRRA